jgi:aspartate racemase
MKTIGLIGGMSWESTVTYYRIVNEVVKEKLGGLHSAKCLLSSVDFQEIETCQAKGEWERSGELLADAAEGLQRAGADFFVICTNTMHKVAPQIASRVTIPLLHIADATADELLSRGVREAALLGTRYTMEQDFYKARLEARGIHVRIPEGSDIALVNGVIFDELCQGIVSDASKAEYLRIIDSLSQKGAGGVILGCTEIGMLVSQKDTSVPLFDTTLIHARRAALYALGQG